MSTLNTLGKLANYNQWANEQLLTWLENLPSATIPSSSLQLLSHIFNAQAIWLYRIRLTTYPGLPFDALSLAACRHLHQTTSSAFISLTALPAPALEEIIKYVNTQGAAYKTAVADILTHVFNHSTYHRAQIARDLRQHGFTPVNTDFINYVRKEIPKPNI